MHTRQGAHGKKAQAVVEMIMILAIGLSIILALLAISNKLILATGSNIALTRSRATLNTLSNFAELIYQQGAGSKTRVYITVPPNVQNFTVRNNTINMQIYIGKDLRDYYRTMDFNITGTLPKEHGNYWICVECMPLNVSISLC